MLEVLRVAMKVKAETLFSLTFEEDMHRTITIGSGHKTVTLNAYGAKKLLTLLDEHRDEIASLSEQLNVPELQEEDIK